MYNATSDPTEAEETSRRVIHLLMIVSLHVKESNTASDEACENLLRNLELRMERERQTTAISPQSQQEAATRAAGLSWTGEHETSGLVQKRKAWLGLLHDLYEENLLVMSDLTRTLVALSPLDINLILCFGSVHPDTGDRISLKARNSSCQQLAPVWLRSVAYDPNEARNPETGSPYRNFLLGCGQSGLKIHFF